MQEQQVGEQTILGAVWVSVSEENRFRREVDDQQMDIWIHLSSICHHQLLTTSLLRAPIKRTGASADVKNGSV